MGKRKSRTSKLMAQPKKEPKLDTEFTCPFCNLRRAVECRIFLKGRPPYAMASCSVCEAVYYTLANALTKPVDVYAEWIDECEKANEGVVTRRARLGEANED